MGNRETTGSAKDFCSPTRIYMGQRNSSSWGYAVKSEESIGRRAKNILTEVETRGFDTVVFVSEKLETNSSAFRRNRMRRRLHGLTKSLCPSRLRGTTVFSLLSL